MSRIVGTIDYGPRGVVRVVEDAAALARESAEALIWAVDEANAMHGAAFVALSGGSTPKQMGQLLTQDLYRARVGWTGAHFFWGDERWVSLSSPESNAGEAKRIFLDRVPVPAANVHPWHTVGLPAKESAARYAETIRSVLSAETALPAFDLIMLGLGDDGHTASLFPGTPAIHETSAITMAQEVPKLNTTRLTFTPPLINAARRVIFLAGGADKAEPLANVLDGPIDPDRLPAQVVRPAGGPIWLVDRAAASALAKSAS
jgi:6-phosphogluconolactonase